MPAFTHHIFVCCNQRSPDNVRGSCNVDGSDALRTALKAELKRCELGPLVRATKSGCLEHCEHGPTIAIYPAGIYYGNVTVADVPRIVSETIIGGRVLPDLEIAESCLNNPDCEHIRNRKAAQ